MARNPKTSRFRIARSQHATQVMKLRLEGLTFREIGSRMGFSEQRAYRICQDELGRLNAIRNETCEQMQRLEVSRLDEMLKAVYAKAKKGDLAAVGRVLDIMTRRAKLLGLDLADKNAPAGGQQVVLNINEVVVTRENKNAEIENSGGASVDGPAPQSTKRLPPE